MKKVLGIFVLAILGVLTSSHAVSAQTRTPEPQVQRDSLLEQDQQRNLEVARQYFVTKKAYRAVVMRCDEIIAAYPEFSRIDEVLYLAGISRYYLLENKGKQKIDLARLNEEDKQRFAPERLREDAVANLCLLVKNYPNSEYKEKAEKTLKLIDKK